MRVSAIDHVLIAMPIGCEDDARAFCRGTLGFHEGPKPPHLVDRGGLWCESESAKIHVGADVEFRPARKAHPALLVDGLDDLIQACETAGYSIVRDADLENCRRAYVYGPFGNRIELMESA